MREQPRGGVIRNSQHVEQGEDRGGVAGTLPHRFGSDDDEALDGRGEEVRLRQRVEEDGRGGGRGFSDAADFGGKYTGSCYRNMFDDGVFYNE